MSGLREDIVPPRSLRFDQWWALDNAARKTQVCSSSRNILLHDYRKWRYNRISATCSPCRVCNYHLYLNGVDGQTRDRLERCVATCGKAAATRAKMRSLAGKEASAEEVRGYYKQYCLSIKSGVQILDWQRGFWSHRHEEGEAGKLCDWTIGVHRQDGQTR